MDGSDVACVALTSHLLARGPAGIPSRIPHPLFNNKKADVALYIYVLYVRTYECVYSFWLFAVCSKEQLGNMYGLFPQGTQSKRNQVSPYVSRRPYICMYAFRFMFCIMHEMLSLPFIHRFQKIKEMIHN